MRREPGGGCRERRRKPTRGGIGNGARRQVAGGGRRQGWWLTRQAGGGGRGTASLLLSRPCGCGGKRREHWQICISGSFLPGEPIGRSTGRVLRACTLLLGVLLGAAVGKKAVDRRERGRAVEKGRSTRAGGAGVGLGRLMWRRRESSTHWQPRGGAPERREASRSWGGWQRA